MDTGYLTEIGRLNKAFFEDKIITKETYQLATNIVKQYTGSFINMRIDNDFGDVVMHIFPDNAKYWVYDGEIMSFDIGDWGESPT